MPTDYVAEVVRLAGAAKTYEQPSEQDWSSAEKSIGCTFPTDYKRLVSALGEGEFGCGLHLRNPRSSSDLGRLTAESLRQHREPISDLEEKLSFPIYPSKDGHVVVGSIDRQDFYFKPAGEGLLLPHVVWLDIDTEEVRHLRYTLPQFIHDLYLGLLHEDWAEELRVYFWRNGGEPFFTARPGRIS